MSRSPRRGRAGSIVPLVAWGTAVAIAGTLCACGRYGPPQRRPSTPAATAVGEPVGEPVGVGGQTPAVDEPDADAPRVDEPGEGASDEKSEKKQQ